MAAILKFRKINIGVFFCLNMNSMHCKNEKIQLIQILNRAHILTVDVKFLLIIDSNSGHFVVLVQVTCMVNLKKIRPIDYDNAVIIDNLCFPIISFVSLYL